MIRCQDCQREYESVMPMCLNLSREQWLLIFPEDGGVLCANCMVARAEKLPGAICMQAKIMFGADYD